MIIAFDANETLQLADLTELISTGQNACGTTPRHAICMEAAQAFFLNSLFLNAFIKQPTLAHALQCLA
ncbi:MULTISPECIES: hypothetical protein [unclassified Pseudomonas]|uniref:hypothetical protein n=1 Tax=unclassified Pseudomonas TaxID=196821 RepID=UPI0011BE5833|nr:MULTISPECIES: hypothetical protein [unclassified Pseudomonas]